MKNILFLSMLVACFFLPNNLSAQNDADALRLSNIQFGSTARSLSLAGAMGALGADFSTFSKNPAGIGIYRKSEFTFSPLITSRTAKSEYLGNSNELSQTPFGIGNAGLVYAAPLEGGSLWNSINYGFGYNRLNTFKQEFGGAGANKSSSLLDGWIANANNGFGTHPDNLSNFPDDAFLGYNTFLIDPIPPDSLNYFSAIPNGGIQQEFNIETKGSFGEIVFGAGANYNNSLFIGLNFSFPTFNYTKETRWQETDVADTVNGPLSVYNFKAFSYNQLLESSGSGFNTKFGLIYRINDYVRLGAHIHSPSWYEVSDEAFNNLTSVFDSSVTYSEESVRLFDYTVRTPYKAGGSAAFLFNGQGLISIDYEFVDYTSMKLKSDFYSFTNENDAIEERYEAAHNIKVGGEYKYGPFTIRGGYALYASPFKEEFRVSGYEQERTSYTGGFGYRNKKIFIDLGYSLTEWGEYYLPYSSDTNVVEELTSDFTEHRFMLTFGARF